MSIGPSVLQACATPLTPILHHLFSLSLNTGAVPTEWKLHSITPIFKSGDISDVKNYRPISLLSNISKVLERLVYNKVLDYYSSSISHFQFGFCKNKSSLQQLLLYFNDLCFSKKQTDYLFGFFQSFWQCPLITNSSWNYGLLGSLTSYGHDFNPIYPIIPRLYQSITVYLIHYLWNPVFRREVF